MCLQKALMEYFYSLSISVIFVKLHDVTQMADNFYSIFFTVMDTKCFELQSPFHACLITEHPFMKKMEM